MKCPLSFLVHIDGHGEPRGDAVDCLQAECAWWDIATEHCAVLALTGILDTLDLRVGAIRNVLAREDKT